MNAYRVYTTEPNDAVFGSAMILCATVLASSEQEALDLVEKEHGDNFVGSKEKREVELIRVNVGSPMVISVEYDHRS